MEQKQILMIAGLMLVVLLLGSFSGVFSVISVSEVSTSSDGKIWVSTFVANNPSGTETVNLVPKAFTNSSGTYTPSGVVSLSFFPINPTCSYALGLRDLPSILGFSTGQYSYLNNFVLSVPYQVKTSKSGTLLTFDGTLSGTTQKIIGTNGCEIFITQVGSYVGKYACPSAGNTGLIQLEDINGQKYNRITKISLIDNRNSIYSGIVLQCGLLGSPLNILNCIRTEQNKAFYEDSTFVNSFVSAPQITSSEIIGKLPVGSYAPSFTVTTNSKCYDIVYTPPETGEPQIIGLSDVSGYSGSTQSAVLSVKNVGKASASFTVETSSMDGSIGVLTPFISDLNIGASQSSGTVVRFTLGSVASDRTASLKVKVCSSSQVKVNCVEQTFSNIVIKPVPVGIGGLPLPLPTATPVPAGQIDCSNIQNSVNVQGICDCPASNSLRILDSNNKLVACGKGESFPSWLVGLSVVGGLVLLVLFLLRGGKGGQRDLFKSVLPFVMPLIIGVIVWWVVSSFSLPFLGNVLAGFALVAGLVAGALVYFNGVVNKLVGI